MILGVEHRRALFKMIAVNASVEITSTLVLTEETGLAPVSEDRHICNLLALRTSDRGYVGPNPVASTALAIAVATALIPDAALAQLSLDDVFGYRQESKDAYAAWSTEIERLAVRISDISPEAIGNALPQIIHEEFRPRMLEYRNAMKATRDKMFGDLIKNVAKWELPSLYLAYVASHSFPAAISLFAGAIAPAVPAVTDYLVARRSRQRNAAAYLVGLIDRTDEL